ncbi:MAG TPA: lamin tail domain-containing protein [Sedimentisphaerales bacterium]|nr:lamin tail domain-containing protein [Sedimentisphaerales bacterium]HRS10634.1 lamin tail domain-containing protein [Sedimentisphaerales bacterium]HRV47339.1 lamin tail domain-containing protein [Sedimentisphaerales bacterium]
MRVVISLLVQSLLLSLFLNGAAHGQNSPPGNDSAPRVIISEIMYHPYHRPETAEDTGQEWIELFNKGRQAVSLAGWRLSDGVAFVFPDVVLEPQSYLVVAADVDAFRGRYPGVDPVAGGWVGWLSNSGEAIELVDAAGTSVDRVEYADEGDWAQRELGPLDHGHRGWAWRDDHDGRGKSLELIDPNMPNEYGQNWGAAAVEGGTPGRANSIHSSRAAPLILDVAHAPVIPTSREPVTISARVVSVESAGVLAVLHYRSNGAGEFTSLAMSEDGFHRAEIPAQADGTVVEFYIEATDDAGHSRTWPAPSLVDGALRQATNALYIVDDSFDPQTSRTPGAHPVYYLVMTESERTELDQIGDEQYSGDLFAAEPMSDAQMNATFISVDGTGANIRYQAGVRNRGNRKRADPPMSFRVNFAGDRPWKDVRALNLNSKYPHLERMASILFQMSGIPAANVTPVRLKVNADEPARSDMGRTCGFYSAVEVLDKDWAKNHFPDDDNGNLYRCTYYEDGVHARTYADLDHKEAPGRAPDPNDYRLNYPKKTNEAADDWSDLFRLIEVLNNRDLSDEDFLVQVSELVNLDEWTRFLAVDALIGNREGGLTSGTGDDYALYSGVVDPRFWLVPHDMDTVLGQGDHSYEPQRDIWVYAQVSGLRRLLNHPDVVRLYYRQCRDLARTIFAPESFDPLVERFLADWVPDSEINGARGIRQFVRDRVNSVLHGGYPDADTSPQIPQRFAVFGPEVVGEYPYTTRDTIDLAGTADAMETRSVCVNGVPVGESDWSQKDGMWSMDDVALNPGINRVIVQTFDGPGGAGRELERGYIDIRYDDGNVAGIGGTITNDTLLDAASGPWLVETTVIVEAGATLAVGPGATLFFEEGAGIEVQQGGRLAIEGTPYQRVRLTHVPNGTGHWEGIRFDQSLEDNRLCCVDMEFGDGQGESVDVQHSRVKLDNVTWAGTNTRILNVDHPTVIARDCVFPSISGAEPIHGVGLTGDEQLVFERCTFGTATGYNDVIDFAGAQRPGPVVQIYDSVFLGGGDDGPDLDGADAHLEGNVFVHFRRNQGGDSTSNAIATGRDGDRATDLCLVRNLFVDNDHAVLVKEDGFLRAEHNTFVNTGIAAISFGEPDRSPPRSPGRGAYMAGNIFWNNAAMFEHFFEEPLPDYGPTDLVVDASILPAVWHDLGVGNIDVDPLFVSANDYHLKPMSAAVASGPFGLDMGAYVPGGAAITGEPSGTTYRTDAILTVGGPGITDYVYSVNSPSGPWSEERPVDVPIELTGLQDGQSYTVYVRGRNSAGRWQEQPNASRTWTVDLVYRRLVINEVLASGEIAFEHEGTHPDVVELFYDGPTQMNLAGVMLSDDPQRPDKFIFPSGVMIGPGEHLVVFADAGASLGIHLGFGLDGEGDELYLYDRDGTLLDHVEFGHQLAGFSIGRFGRDGLWRLTIPSFGAPNVVQPVGDPDRVRINEWLARGEVLFERDFIELHNPHALPVDIGCCYLTDNPVTQCGEFRIQPLTFIEGEGFGVFIADEEDLPGHVSFKLSTDGEMIGLFDPNLREVDKVFYGPQVADVSQGRAPDGTDQIDWFDLPTPGLANPVIERPTVMSVVLVPEDAPKWAIVPTSADQVDENWRSDVSFDDSAWLSASDGPGGVGYEGSSGYEDLIGLDVRSQMYGRNTTCYVRIPFTVAAGSIGSLSELTLSVRYDDGFIAWLNGTEIARANISGSPQWNSVATGNNEAGAEDFDAAIDISEYIGWLREGVNLLAIQGLNVSATSSDFLVSAELSGTVVEHAAAAHPYLRELQLLDGLRVTELMYDAAEGDSLDYIELANVGDVRLDLTGIRFADGIEFTFPAMELAPGQCTVVVDDPAAFRSRYGTDAGVAGQYSGRLSDNGEDIVLKLATPFDAAIARFRYDDKWYPATDGDGMSLAVRDPAAPTSVWNDPANWYASAPTPGQF